MKNKVKIASLLLAIVGLSGCEVNDPINDWADLGQQTAYVYWELKDAVNAGSELDFRVYYYTDGSTVESAQVWYGVNSTITRAVTCPYISYTYTETESSEVVASHLVKEFDPSTVSWDDAKSSYILDSTFPVSASWASVTWANVGGTDFTETLFQTYFPGEYETNFRAALTTQIATDYHGNMKKIVVDGFMRMTEEEYEALFTTSVDAEGKTVYNITDENKATLDGIVAGLTTPELLFDGKEYGVNYNCAYTLTARFQVTDSKGVKSNTDIKNITVN
ncbi:MULTISPECIES: hypothetical protein [Barnesiella]|uniref:hypothetical protein n=1 Tax=Barnesiella TaxID=397864 RepID=UPI0021AC56BD|nr:MULTISPECIES: hypothetical protein [Barnesiella]MCR8911374.1 hypothetical protein [Barnesiella sp. ET7]MDM8268907.1 hypothetical protein [Barnesiella viscericola]